MQKQQVFKVKGMQRDASMANANGEFAYEILNMRLMPAEDLSGFSLTNEKGTLATGITLLGQVIGQCPTNDSLVVFTTQITFSPGGSISTDYIYEIWEGQGEDQTVAGWNEIKWRSKILYQGNLNFNIAYPIEALFNYETEDIQKVYWVDGINQLRCINIVASDSEKDNWNDQSFDSVKEISSIPSVEIERVVGGNFTAGVIQYYVTYFNKFLSESPIVYTSPLLYIAHDNRGANVNDQVSTAFKLTFTNLDTDNWEYIRIYATHRTSIDATPEASVVNEMKISSRTSFSFIDFGSNRVSIAPSDLYFIGSKFVKAGTMTVKDQVLFLGHLSLEEDNRLDLPTIQNDLRKVFQHTSICFSLTSTKTSTNNFYELEGSYYLYKNNLSNTKSITHLKYRETYRFGICLQDKYGTWSNPLWIKDDTIAIAPRQSDNSTLELPCPQLYLDTYITIAGSYQTLRNYFKSAGAIAVKPVIVFPSVKERSIVAQGAVCPTIYNLQDRKSNSPYAQASWFMRPNLPADLWGFEQYDYLGTSALSAQGALVDIVQSGYIGSIGTESSALYQSPILYHKSDLLLGEWSNFKDDAITTDRDTLGGYFGVGANPDILLDEPILFVPNHNFPANYSIATGQYFKYSPYSETQEVYLLTNNSPEGNSKPIFGYMGKKAIATGYLSEVTLQPTTADTVTNGAWLEFRHNYALRTKGWTFGAPTGTILMGGNTKVSFQNKGLNYANTIPISNVTEGAIGQPVMFSEYDKTSEFATFDSLSKKYLGGTRSAEISNTRFAVTVPVNRFNSKLGWGPFVKDTYNDGSNAYYVDNSIITLNSPEFELSSDLDNMLFNDCYFRIIGIIPLTSTTSDISLETSAAMPNLGAQPVGLNKIQIQHKNINEQACKGAVGSSGYYAPYEEDLHTYGYITLSPWHSSDSLGLFVSSSEFYGSKEMLVKKILSNLRFSASSYYFGEYGISLDRNEQSDITNSAGEEASNYEGNGYGWKPLNGSVISLFKHVEGTGIIKLFGNHLPTDIVYKGNIDVVALPTAAGQSISTYEYGAGKVRGLTVHNSPKDLGTAPMSTDTIFKRDAKGVGIKYKSSPHAVIAFNPIREADLFKNNSDLLIQETLPTICSLNHEGFSLNRSKSVLEEMLMNDKTRLYENKNIRGVYHQSELILQEETFLPGVLSRSIKDIYFPKYGSAAGNATAPTLGWIWLGEICRNQAPTFGGTSEFALQNNAWVDGGPVVSLLENESNVNWEYGDTYYQRFDSLKTYAYDDKAPNSVIDITSFMVETHINIDGRTDRNRGQESNLQMSPTNFNLINDVYSQRDNFFTYRILDEDLQARTNFPNQITWSLTKTAGATVDAWMNITLASVLDLDGTKGELTALKNFNNNIIAFQEKGLSNIMFNSRAQIATSEAVPIQIANTGKVDGQQYFTTEVGCQDKWNIVTTPNGLYFVDYFNKSIYRFNGQLEDISTPNGFRSWCYENLNSTTNIIGYYDVKNKEVMYYIGNTGFMLDNGIHPDWLGFSELTGAFSSFYTYPKAWFSNIQDRGVWLLSDTRSGISVYAHQMGNYNSLLNKGDNRYGITVIPRQDSNTVKTFNNVEFRADSYNGGILDDNHTFDTISAETEYQTRTPKTLTYSPYRPSNLKKKLRTWRANIPRVNNGYNRFVNQWAKIGLWKMDPSTEKTILHDLSVWYSE